MYNYDKLARAILSQGVKDRWYFDEDRDWLQTLCVLADLTYMEYFEILNYIYGRRNK